MKTIIFTALIGMMATNAIAGQSFRPGKVKTFAAATEGNYVLKADQSDKCKPALFIQFFSEQSSNAVAEYLQLSPGGYLVIGLQHPSQDQKLMEPIFFRQYPENSSVKYDMENDKLVKKQASKSYSCKFCDVRVFEITMSSPQGKALEIKYSSFIDRDILSDVISTVTDDQSADSCLYQRQ
jgi:hypothetical protein